MKPTASLALIALLASCAPAPQASLPAPATPAAFDEAPAPAPAQAAWWESFRDPTLTRLIALGLAQNLSVKLAVERITEAEANATAAGSGAFPQLSLSASGGRSDPGPVTAGSVTAQAGWLVDLFGRNRSSRAAAGATRDAAWASADLARVAMAGAIATAYADLRYYQTRIALTRQSRASRAETASLIHNSQSLGAASTLDTLRADQLVALAEAQLPALEVGEAAALNHLATLTGQTTATLAPMLARGGQPVPHFRASVGVPAEVLRHRPDVIVAERNYAAAAAAIGVARADLYPSLSLGGAITGASVRGGASTTTWSFGPEISLPIFSGGRLQANLTAAQSRAVQAHLAWQQTVLGAVEEIQTALAAYSRDGRNMAAQQKLIDISTQTLDLARASFTAGEGDFLGVLEAERTLLDARGALAEANRTRAQNFIRLSMATASGGTTP
ncbi:efflux transporter outer membrane subunit [Stagnihabitans tardus]|uniref:Efflux transporter outer membrane subunit n=1 Tax=Stagnihabitans tardus TaxID=2699202 RepID=A0AAE4YD93_9RHOB|nr:efflux transporter outer membrane subunit [Stagnihabitans tardus]NBZ89934.1 efflux transporter outer membrane subunit [Stagnihabitans tardus]